MTSPVSNGPGSPPLSTFVTVVAWLGIVFSGFAALIGAIQNVVVRMMPQEQFSAMENPPAELGVPPLMRAVFGHFRLGIFVVFLLSLLALASSIGLLQRRNWARLAIIGVLACGIAYGVLMIFLTRSMSTAFDSFRAAAEPTAVPDSAQRQAVAMFHAMGIAMDLISVGIMAVCGWVIAKLCSEAVRTEFSRPSAA